MDEVRAKEKFPAVVNEQSRLHGLVCPDDPCLLGALVHIFTDMPTLCAFSNAVFNLGLDTSVTSCRILLRTCRS